MLYPVIVRPPPRINDGAAISDLFALLLAIVVIVGAALGEPLIAAVGALVFVVTIAARLWARLSLEEVSYGRELSADHLFQGDEIKLSLALENNKPLPVPWVRVRDFLPLGLQDASDTIVERPFLGGSEITEITSLGRYERVRINFRVRAANRGFYRLGPAKLESGDSVRHVRFHPGRTAILPNHHGVSEGRAGTVAQSACGATDRRFEDPYGPIG